MKGVIFDFNGTLLWDSQLHIDTWIEFSKKLRDVPFTVDEMLHHMFGKTNKDILTYALNREPDEELLNKIAYEKEAAYREICKNNPDKFKLAPHVIELLDYLKEIDFPMAIATMSEWCNVEFYINELNLLNWFKFENIIYSDGTMPGKPAPDIYLKAAKAIDISINDCIVFEDAISGIDAAKNAGAGKIIAVASREPVSFYENISGISKVITNFNQVDYSIFS